jgi:hypothetical protein
MMRDSCHGRLVTGLLVAGACGALLTAQEGMPRDGRGGPPPRTTPVRGVAGVRDGVSVHLRVDYAQLKPLKPGESGTVTWLVKGAGTATVSIASTRGGVDRKDVVVK